jgi:OOP family OmpA-OmpF porin
MAALKRPASEAAAVVPTKRFLSHVAKLCDEVSEEVMGAESLPKDVRKMLCADLKASLGVPRADRHAFQAKVIAWIGDALSSVKAAAASELQGVEAELSDQEAEKARREAKLEEAKQTLASKEEKEKADEAGVKAATGEVKTAKAALKEAEKEQKDGDKELGKAQAEKTKLDEHVTNHFTKLMTEGSSAEDGKKHLSALEKLATEYEFDKSMVASLGSGLLKAPDTRGDFDKMVLSAFEAQLQKHVADAASTLAAGQPAKEARDSKVEAAKATLQAATEAEEAKKKELEGSAQEVKDADAALKEAAKSVKQYASDMKAKVDACATCKKRVGSLAKGALAAYAELQTLAVPAPGSTSQYRSIDGVRYEKELLDIADAEKAAVGTLGEEQAAKLFTAAMDGPGVTPTEKRTLKYIIKTYKLDEAATNYLKTKMDSSWYQAIDGVTYERALLAVAADVPKPISLDSAEKIWNAAMDGAGVTPTEKKTLTYILDKNRFDVDAKLFLEGKVGGVAELSEE